MAKPNVTVLIPTFNRARYLPESLDSVLGQTIPPAQVIVINDGSTDNTREVLAPYMDRIEYIEKENGGKSTALNLALPRVRGDYVWIMDDDDVALPDALETHLAVLENDPGIGFTYTPGYVGKTGPVGSAIQILSLSPLPDVSEDEFFIRYLQGWALFHDAMLVRSACYMALGGFDPELTRSQDYEMTLRLARRFRAGRIDKPTIVVRLHPGMRGRKNDQFNEEMRAAKWREYDAKIFERLRNELDLGEYLPESYRDTTLGPELKRRAYLERMCVAASKGMFDGMLCDLRFALAETGKDSLLTQAERTCVCRTMSYLRPGDRFFCDPELAKSVRLLCTGRTGRDVMIEIARGLYWRFMNALKARRYRFSGEIALGAWRLLRLRGGSQAAMQKLRELLAARDQQTAA